MNVQQLIEKVRKLADDVQKKRGDYDVSEWTYGLKKKFWQFKYVFEAKRRKGPVAMIMKKVALSGLRYGVSAAVYSAFATVEAMAMQNIFKPFYGIKSNVEVSDHLRKLADSLESEGTVKMLNGTVFRFLEGEKIKINAKLKADHIKIEMEPMIIKYSPLLEKALGVSEVTCPHCGKTTPVSAGVCVYCNRPLFSYCMKCRRIVLFGDKCPHCGAQLLKPKSK